MPGTLKLEKISTQAGSDQRQAQIQFVNAVKDAQMSALGHSTDVVWSWQTASSNSLQALGRGSTDTAIASGKLTFAVGGIPESKAAVTTGTAISAQTVTADMWALYVLDIAAGGSITVTAAADNVAGYTTEALAIAALPVRVTAKARLGYITVKTKASTAWIAATDGLAGGSSGNVATTTNYYPYDGVFAPTGTAIGSDGSTVTAAVRATGSAWTGGRNGVLIATVLDRGSTDTNVESTAFVYSANGITNLNKAAVTAGTAFGALGTIPADKWGVFGMYIDTAGTITYIAGPANFDTGYANEQDAIGGLNGILPVSTSSTGRCQMGYVTVKTASGLTWVTGTDALAGGTSGNEASSTNYYPTAGVTLLQGQTASLIANRGGTVLTSAQY